MGAFSVLIAPDQTNTGFHMLVNLNLPPLGDKNSIVTKHIFNGQFENCPKLKLVNFTPDLILSDDVRFANELLAIHLAEHDEFMPDEFFWRVNQAHDVCFPGTRYRVWDSKSKKFRIGWRQLRSFNDESSWDDEFAPGRYHSPPTWSADNIIMLDHKNVKNLWFCVVDDTIEDDE